MLVGPAMPTPTGADAAAAQLLRARRQCVLRHKENWLTMWTRRPVTVALAIFSSSDASSRCSRYARMAFRIGADADFLDAGVRKPPFWITASASAIRPGGIDVAADHQQALRTGFAASRAADPAAYRHLAVVSPRYGRPVRAPLCAVLRQPRLSRPAAASGLP